MSSFPRSYCLTHVRARARPSARTPAGYRDVALYVRLTALGPESHVCELQLQLLCFARVKSDSGHRRYVSWRNALGL